MNKTLNTQIVLEHRLDAEAVDFIERMVAAGHELNLTDQGPQPTLLIGAGKNPFTGAEVLAMAKWARKEAALTRAFRVLSMYYPNGMTGRAFNEEQAACRARLNAMDEELGKRCGPDVSATAKTTDGAPDEL